MGWGLLSGHLLSTPSRGGRLQMPQQGLGVLSRCSRQDRQVCVRKASRVDIGGKHPWGLEGGGAVWLQEQERGRCSHFHLGVLRLSSEANSCLPQPHPWEHCLWNPDMALLSRGVSGRPGDGGHSCDTGKYLDPPQNCIPLGL